MLYSILFGGLSYIIIISVIWGTAAAFSAWPIVYYEWHWWYVPEFITIAMLDISFLAVALEFFNSARKIFPTKE